MSFPNLVYTVLIIVIALILDFSSFIRKNSKIILRFLKQNVVQAYISDVLLRVSLRIVKTNRKAVGLNSLPSNLRISAALDKFVI